MTRAQRAEARAMRGNDHYGAGAPLVQVQGTATPQLFFGTPVGAVGTPTVSTLSSVTPPAVHHYDKDRPGGNYAAQGAFGYGLQPPRT